MKTETAEIKYTYNELFADRLLTTELSGDIVKATLRGPHGRVIGNYAWKKGELTAEMRKEARTLAGWTNAFAIAGWGI